MPSLIVWFIINSIALLVAIILAVIVLQGGVRYNFFIGYTNQQRLYRLRITQSIIALLLIALAATIFNLLFR